MFFFVVVFVVFFHYYFLSLIFFLKDSIPAFSGLKVEIVSKPVIVKIGSIEVSGSYFTLEHFLPYPLTSMTFSQPVSAKEKNLEITYDKILLLQLQNMPL